MNTEQERAELLPCPFCGGSVSFHQDDEECGEGCHYIECKTCGMFDLSTAADPTNTVEDLGELRARIAPLWNRRAALQSQNDISKLVKRLREADKPLMQQNTFSEVRALLREAAEALQSQDREDAERLEWLVEAMGRLDMDEGHMGWFILERDTSRYVAEDCKTFREAIDHARRIEGDGE